VKTLTAIAVCCTALLACDPFARARAAPPNVLMILSDDQAWNDYGFMGHKVIQTPHLDRLAKESVLFTRGYVPTSLCRPSLMSIITGLYPHQHKIYGNDPPKGTDRAQMLRHVAAAPTLPRLLAAANYASLQTGKWWEGNSRLGGFTHGMTHGDPQRGGRHGDLGLKIGREGLQPIFDFLQDRGDRPFFIWYAPMLPHQPHNPPPRLWEKYSQKVASPHVAKYYAMCEWFDETCGQLLEHLDQQGLRENTLVIYVTDNGWIQDPQANTFAPRSKRSPYDGGLRTPIMLRWPAKLQPLRDDHSLVSSLDLAPTILAGCGLQVPPAMPGENLLAVAGGQPLRREAVFGEIFAHDEVDLDEPASGLLYRWCIAGDWKIIVPKAGQPCELYDLAKDPWERQNLAQNREDMVGQLRGRLEDWWRIP
jgi:uncharacterized sulfatase